MNKAVISKWLNYFIATVWIVSGLLCKLLNLVPRHQEIIARILGESHARLFTDLIGIAEIGMAVWIVSGLFQRTNVVIQIVLIAVMNTLEFFLAPDLLLWGRANAIFAFLFILLIYSNEFRFKKISIQETLCSPS